jgi:hypothetical protein
MLQQMFLFYCKFHKLNNMVIWYDPKSVAGYWSTRATRPKFFGPPTLPAYIDSLKNKYAKMNFRQQRGLSSFQKIFKAKRRKWKLRDSKNRWLAEYGFRQKFGFNNKYMQSVRRKKRKRINRMKVIR